MNSNHRPSLTLLLGVGALKELVEDVETPLFSRLSKGSRLLEKIVFDVGSRNKAGHVEVDADEFSLQMRVLQLFKIFLKILNESRNE